MNDPTRRALLPYLMRDMASVSHEYIAEMLREGADEIDRLRSQHEDDTARLERAGLIPTETA